MLEELYYLKRRYIPDIRGDREEWRVHRISYVESIYINYNGASPNQESTSWLWAEWYLAEKSARQEWFKKMRFDCVTEKICNPVAVCTSTCPPANSYQVVGGWLTPDQQGISPMKTLTSSTDLTINASTAPSDASKARDFLMSEFMNLTNYSWRDPRYTQMAKLYNIDAPTAPTTSQQIIDAFKNGKVVIDQAKVDRQTAYFAAVKGDVEDECDCGYESGITSRYFGVTFTDLPVEDRKGYNAAVLAYDALKTATKRKLAILDPEAGLEVLTAFEAWQPTLATDTAH